MITAGHSARLSAAGGVLGAALVLVAWPGGWVLGLALVGGAAFGLRAVAAETPGPLFGAIKWAATGIGALAALSFALAIFGLALTGRWT